MATNEQFNYTVTVFTGYAECNKQSQSMPKTKLKCQYDGLRLTLTMRFGKGTESPKEPVNVVFDSDAGNLTNLGIQMNFIYKKPFIFVRWECRNSPIILNYTSYRADLKTTEHKFADFLLNEGVKTFDLQAPAIGAFSLDEWKRIVSTHEKCVVRRQEMLAMYPSPWHAERHLPLITNTPAHTAVNSFPDTLTWGTVIYAALARETSVTLSNQGEAKTQSCWGIFEKVGDSIFCQVYSNPARKNQPSVAVPMLSEKLKIVLRDDGCRQLSNSAKEVYRDAVVTDLGKNADFVVRLKDSDNIVPWSLQETAQWTEQDMNYGQISTIAIRRKENLVSLKRHMASVVQACTKLKSPMPFPLEQLLLLKGDLPRVKRTPWDSRGKTCLGPMLSLLNPTQQNAFKRSHDTGRPALVVQGPPGTGKTYALAVISLSYSLVRKMKCLICTPSNNAGNAFTDKIMDVWTKENTRLGLGHLKIVRWLTPTAEHCIMTTGRAVGIPESMASISMASHIRAYAQSLADTHDGDEWLRLCRRLGSLSRNDYERFKYLTAEYERHCLGQMDIVVTTCDNSWTLRPEQFQPNIIILDECSQAIEAAALLPVVQFIGRLEQVIFAGDDQQLQPFVLSAPEENEFACQLRKSWFERARLSAVVPCVTLGQQYRMRPEISRLIIHHFYRNKLENDVSIMVDRPAYQAYMQVAQELNLSGIYWAATEWPISNVLMVDMPEGTRTLSRTDRAGSKFNNGHIAIVREICLTLLAPQTDIYGRQIAVITPYAAQRVRHIRAMSEATRLNLEMGKVIVSTVDRFQGQEADIVLLDLVVRSNDTDGLGFMRDKNRLNVAISRARDVLIVIGDGRKYRRLLSKPRVAKGSCLFLEIMCDIGSNTVLWYGNRSAVVEFEEWDMSEEGLEHEAEHSGDETKHGGDKAEHGPEHGGDDAMQDVQYRY